MQGAQHNQVICRDFVTVLPLCLCRGLARTSTAAMFQGMGAHKALQESQHSGHASVFDTRTTTTAPRQINTLQCFRVHAPQADGENTLPTTCVCPVQSFCLCRSQSWQ
jgi:hypothetical protein